MNKLIGLSLSGCVEDILLGRVKVEDIVEMRTSTSVGTEAEWLYLILAYSRTCWKDHPAHEIVDVVTKLKNGKFYQPRVAGLKPESTDKGRWLDAETGEYVNIF